MSSKSNKIYPSNDIDDPIKPAERRRKNSNGSAASPRTESSSRPSIVKMGGKQNSFTGLSGNKDRENNTPRGGGGSNNSSSHASPRIPPPLTRARTYAEGESLHRSRSNSISMKGDGKLPSLRRNSSFKFRKKRVTFRSPLTEFEPGWGYAGDADNTPTTADADVSLSNTMAQLEDDLRRRQENRRKRRDRGERSAYNVNNVSCLGLMMDGCAMMVPSCTIS